MKIQQLLFPMALAFSVGTIVGLNLSADDSKASCDAYCENYCFGDDEDEGNFYDEAVTEPTIPAFEPK